MKWIISLLMVGVLAACAGTKFEQHPQVEVKEATSQSWAGGMIGSGFGTNYRLTVQYAGSDSIGFDTLWVEARPFVPTITKKMDEYHLFAKLVSKPKRDPQTGEVNESEYIEHPPKSEEPPKYEGEGMLVYTIDGRQYAHFIERFEKMEPLNYP